MYIESVPNRGSPPAILLRESFRDNGRVRKRTLANLSAWPTALVEGFRSLLKGGVAVAADGIRVALANITTTRRWRAKKTWLTIKIIPDYALSSAIKGWYKSGT